MAEFFKQLRISEETANRIAKEKIDGKKFARMTEAELDTYGLMHPIVVHFRKRTHSTKQSRKDFQLWESNQGLSSIYGIARSQPMREDVTYVTSSPIGRDLAGP